MSTRSAGRAIGNVPDLPPVANRARCRRWRLARRPADGAAGRRSDARGHRARSRRAQPPTIEPAARTEDRARAQPNAGRRDRRTRGTPSSRALLLHLSPFAALGTIAAQTREQLHRADVERRRELEDVRQARIARSTLDAADVGPIEPARAARDFLGRRPVLCGRRGPPRRRRRARPIESALPQLSALTTISLWTIGHNHHKQAPRRGGHRPGLGTEGALPCKIKLSRSPATATASLERAIVSQTLRDDHDKRWSRAELAVGARPHRPARDRRCPYQLRITA